MRFHPPRTPRSAVVMFGLAGLIAFLTPARAVDRVISRIRTAGHRDRSRQLRRMVLGDDPDALAHLMRGSEPVIVTDLYERLTLATPPDPTGLRELGARVDTGFSVTRYEEHSPYFLYVGDYGAVKRHTDRLDLAAFLDDMFGGGDHERGTCTYKLFSARDLDGAIGGIIGEMAEQLEAMTGRRADVNASGIWVGSTGVTTPLHHDAWTGLLFQTTGSKRVTMYGPVDRDNVYLTSPFEPTGRWSALPPRSREADPAEFPRLSRATRFEGVLEAGDTLFIPPFWSHEVEALEPNISIPFRFATRTRDFFNPGFLRPAVEIFHGKYVAPAA